MDANRRKIKLTIECEVEESVTDDEIADKVSAALKPERNIAAGFGKLSIQTLEGADRKSAVLGYESRAWTKTTC